MVSDGTKLAVEAPEPELLAMAAVSTCTMLCVGGGGAIRHTYSNNKGERDKKIMGIETNKSKEQTFFLLFFLFFSVKYNYARSMVRRFTKSIDY